MGGPVSVSGAGDGVAQRLPTAFPVWKSKRGMKGVLTPLDDSAKLSPTQPLPHLHMTATSPAMWMA